MLLVGSLSLNCFHFDLEVYCVRSYHHIITVWHEIFAAVYFCCLVISCVLWELIFVIRTDWYFLLRINFCDFHKVSSTQP